MAGPLGAVSVGDILFDRQRVTRSLCNPGRMAEVTPQKRRPLKKVTRPGGSPGGSVNDTGVDEAPVPDGGSTIDGVFWRKPALENASDQNHVD